MRLCLLSERMIWQGVDTVVVTLLTWWHEPCNHWFRLLRQFVTSICLSWCHCRGFLQSVLTLTFVVFFGNLVICFFYVLSGLACKSESVPLNVSISNGERVDGWCCLHWQILKVLYVEQTVNIFNLDDKLQYKLIWQITNMFVILTVERNVFFTALLMLMNFANEYCHWSSVKLWHPIFDVIIHIDVSM